MRTKCPRTGFRRGGSVRLKPPFRMEGDGPTAFQVIHDALPPRPGRCPVKLCCQVVKELSIVRGRLGALLLIVQIICSLNGPSPGAGIQSGKRGQSVLFNNAQLTRARETIRAEGARRIRAFRKLVAAARNPRFGAKPGSAVAVRRRRNMNCYFHSSTVCRMRRETLRVFFASRAGVTLRRDQGPGCRSLASESPA
jgi:hypothetical protein